MREEGSGLCSRSTCGKRDQIYFPRDRSRLTLSYRPDRPRVEPESVPSSRISGRPPHAAAAALLEAAGLPTEDLADDKLEHFFLAGDSAAPVGLVGLELFGRVALLRSLVVTPVSRTAGIGRQLVAHAEAYAASRGVRSIYLLTTTAEGFFAARGYSRRRPRHRARADPVDARVRGPLSVDFRLHGEATREEGIDEAPHWAGLRGWLGD